MKNVKFRLFEPAKNGNYYKLSMQILVQQRPNSEYLAVAGYVTWQANDENGTCGEWYAMNFSIDTDNFRYIEYMAKLAKFLKEVTFYNSQPKEIISILESNGGEEYTTFQTDFIPVKYIGLTCFNVLSNDGNLYTRIYAANEILAAKQLAKTKYPNYTIKPLCVVSKTYTF